MQWNVGATRSSIQTFFHCLSLSNCFLRTSSQKTETDEMYLSYFKIKTLGFSKAIEAKNLH